MEILEAFDLTGTLRGAAELAGCDHKTVAALGACPRGGRRRVAGGGAAAAGGRCVRGEDRGVGGSLARQDPRGRRARAAGGDGLSGLGAHDAPRGRRGQAPLARRSTAGGRGRGSRSRGCGCSGTMATGPWSRAARRCCSARGWRGRGSGWCCRCGIRTMASVVMALDRALRAFGGAPTYALTDNERTVSIDHVVRDRGPQPADRVRRPPLRADDRDVRAGGSAEQGRLGGDGPDREGRSGPDRSQPARATTRTSRELEAACARVLRARQRARAPGHAPAAGGDAGRGARAAAPAAARCRTRSASARRARSSWQSTISVGGAIYSVPSTLVDERVWARADGDELVVVHADAPDGPREVARHELTTPGRPRICDEHYPPRPPGALERVRGRAAPSRAGVPCDRAGRRARG